MEGSTVIKGSKEKGFTLVEVMVATVMLAVCLLMIYNVLVKTFSASSRVEAKIIANNIAQEAMEDIINRPYSNVALWAGSGITVPTTFDVNEKGGSSYTEDTVRKTSGTESDYVSHIQNRTIAGITFIITTYISWHDDPVDDSAPTDPNPQDYKRVHITVTWGSKPSPSTEIILDRFISMYFKPQTNGSSSVNTGEVRLTGAGGSDYVKLGSSAITNYSGGNLIARSESRGANTKNTEGSINESADLSAWARSYTDDDSHSDAPTAEQKTDGGGNISDGLISISSTNNDAKTASGVVNVIGDDSYGSWHNGELGLEGIWDTWSSPPEWDDGHEWTQPSGICKSESNQIKWAYSPNIDPVNFVEIGSSISGVKMVTTSAVLGNRITSRSWSSVNNIKIIDLNDIAGEDLPEDGLVKADSIKVWSENIADGSSNTATIDWEINNLNVWNRNTQSYQTFAKIDPSNVGSTTIVWPNPIDSTSIEIGQVSTSTTSLEAIATGTILEFNILESTIGSIDVPASKVTIGIIDNSISYTWAQ